MSFLEAILDALDERVRQAIPRDALNELGVFVEWFHDTIREALGLPSKDIRVLHVDLAAIGIGVGASAFAGLVAAAGRRNVADHAGTGREFLNARQRDGALLNVRGDVEMLMELLDEHGHLDCVLRAIQLKPPELPGWLKAAEGLAQILESEPIEEILPIALEEAPSLRNVNIAGIPEAKRLRVVLRTIGRGVDGAKRLGAIAQYAQRVVNESAGEQLVKWARQLEIRAASPRPERLKVLRVDLDASDRPDGFIVRRARMVSPDLALDRACSRVLPREVRGMKALGQTLRALLREITRDLIATGRGQVPAPDVVLLLTVPSNHWSLAVEELEDDVGARMHALFQCLVVRPPSSSGASMRGGWVDHPGSDAAQSRSYLLAEYQEPARVVELMSGRECLFVGRDALLDPRSPPVLPSAFRYYPCAVVDRSGDMGVLLDAIFPASRVPLGSLFKNITALRKAGGRVTVLWDDLDYQPEELMSLEELDGRE